MYTDKTSVENYLMTSINVDFEYQVTAWIAAVQRWIDTYTYRSFEKTSATRKFDGSGTDVLYVDDLLSVDSIKIKSMSAQTLWTLGVNDFFLYSNLYKADDPNSLPIDHIVINPWGSHCVFDYGLQNIVIEGDWGYSETAPEDIKMVATKLVASIIKAGKDGQIKSFSEGDLSITFDDFSNNDLSIKSILDYYKRPGQLTGFKISRS